MTTLNAPAPSLTTSLNLTRKDVFLIADVETRHGGKFNMTVHSVPKNDESAQMVEKLKETPFAFRWGDYNDAVHSYVDFRDGSMTLRASRENWHYAGWNNEAGEEQNGWMLLGSDFNNDEKALGALGLPVMISHSYASTGKEFKNRAHIPDPSRFAFSPTTDVAYEKLPKSKYAVSGLHAHMDKNGYINWIAFNKQNHPEFGVSTIVYAGSHPGNRMERRITKTEGNDKSQTLSYEEAAPLWEKLRQYDRSAADLCNVLGVPDVSLACTGKPTIIADINALNFDGVTGNECPALAPTYQRLGTYRFN